MISIATIMGLTSYNPYKEAISIALGGVGPYLIDTLTLKPTNTISKIDHIRETLFEIRTRFLKLTQKNAITKYTWVFLKNVPISMALSRVVSLASYLLIRIEGVEFINDAAVLIHINCAKHLAFLLFLSLFVKEALSPPKKRFFTEPRWTSLRGYYSERSTRLPKPNTHGGGWKDYRRISAATNLGEKSPINPLKPNVYKSF